MSTLLNNDVAPLWVWILVIVIGSLIVISLVVFVWWLVRRRRRLRPAGLDLEPGTVPTRKLTVKGGKVVPTQSKVSLTTTREERLSGDTANHSAPGRDSLDWRASSKDTRQDEISLYTPSVSSIQDGPSATRAGATSMKAPRLSLNEVGEREHLSNFSSVHDPNVINKPSMAVIHEPHKSKIINFSRPHIRPASAPAPAPKKNRLSVINESTPRNSFVNRIVSWASNSHDGEPRQSEMKEVQDDDQPARFSHSRIQSQESGTVCSSPIEEILWELHHLIEAPTPEIPNRHPERTADAPDDVAISIPSGSDFDVNGQTGPGHIRHDSGANFSRKRSSKSSTVSRANSSAKLSQRHTGNTSIHSRTSSNMSWLEQPQATLTGPFDAPVSLTRPISEESSWSDDTNLGTVTRHYGSYQNQHHRHHSSVATVSSHTATSVSTETHSAPSSRPVIVPAHSRSASSTLEGNMNVQVIGFTTAQPMQMKRQRNGNQISNLSASPSPILSPILSPALSPGLSPGLSPRPSPRLGHDSDGTLSRSRSRSLSFGRSLSRSRSRSRGPIRTTSKNGRQVLRKRSMQTPEITMIGPVDPTTLENLSLAGL